MRFFLGRFYLNAQHKQVADNLINKINQLWNFLHQKNGVLDMSYYCLRCMRIHEEKSEGDRICKTGFHTMSSGKLNAGVCENAKWSEKSDLIVTEPEQVYFRSADNIV